MEKQKNLPQILPEIATSGLRTGFAMTVVLKKIPRPIGRGKIVSVSLIQDTV